MSSVSLKAKAIAAIDQDRVRVVRANDAGIALDVIASKPDPATLRRPTYRAMVYRRDGHLVRECGCPAVRRCYHVFLAELIWRPGLIEEASDR